MSYNLHSMSGALALRVLEDAGAAGGWRTRRTDIL
jgi:hypothetical protein